MPLQATHELYFSVWGFQNIKLDSSQLLKSDLCEILNAKQAPVGNNMAIIGHLHPRCGQQCDLCGFTDTWYETLRPANYLIYIIYEYIYSQMHRLKCLNKIYLKTHESFGRYRQK